MFVCLCVCKLFSGTTGPRTLIFGTNFGYDLLYSVLKRESGQVMDCCWPEILVTHCSLCLLRVSCKLCDAFIVNSSV